MCINTLETFTPVYLIQDEKILNWVQSHNGRVDLAAASLFWPLTSGVANGAASLEIIQQERTLYVEYSGPVYLSYNTHKRDWSGRNKK